MASKGSLKVPWMDGQATPSSPSGMPREIKAIYARMINPNLERAEGFVVAVKGKTNLSDVDFDENGTARFYHVHVGEIISNEKRKDERP